MNEISQDAVFVGKGRYVPLDRFRNPEKRGMSDRMEIMAPVGLQRFTQEVITPALDAYQQPSAISRIRVVPVAVFSDFQGVAFYQQAKDYIQVSVPLNELRLYYYQRALPILDELVDELKPRLTSLSPETYEAFTMSRQEVDKAIDYPSPENTYNRYGSPERYHLEKKFDIFQKAIDLYVLFESNIKESPENRLPSDQKKNLVDLVRHLETRLMEVDRNQVASFLENTSNDVPPSYNLFYMIMRTHSRLIDVNSKPFEYLGKFEEMLKDLTEHEYQHQMFTHKKHPGIVEAIKKKMDTQPSEVEIPEMSDQEKKDVYRRDVERKRRIEHIIQNFNDGTIDLREALQTFSSINISVAQELLPRISDVARREGILLRNTTVGIEESVIAMLYAHKHKESFLEQIQPYVTKLDCLLLSAKVLLQLKAVVDRLGDDPEACLNEVMRKFYTKRNLERRAEEVLKVANS